jgi:hypothetical protein
MERIPSNSRIRTQSKVSLCCEEYPVLLDDGKPCAIPLAYSKTDVPAAEQRITQLPHSFVLPELTSNKVAYVKDFVKTKTDLKAKSNLASVIDITRNDYDLSQQVFATFKTAELLSKQETLFDFLITKAVKHGMYKAMHQANNPRLYRLPASHPFYQNNNKLVRPSFPKPRLTSSLTPATSAICKGKTRPKTTCIIVTPLSHHDSSVPSSSRMPPRSMPNSQVWIDLTSPEPEPSTLTPLQHLPTPPPMCPDHMRNSNCHSCGKIGHFASFRLQYKCVICKKVTPKHYQNACPN